MNKVYFEIECDGQCIGCIWHRENGGCILKDRKGK